MSNLFGKKRSGTSTADPKQPASGGVAPSRADTQTDPKPEGSGAPRMDIPPGPPPLPGRRSSGSGIMHPHTRRGVASPGAGADTGATQASANSTRKLVVGREIVLSGEIQACERLIVEGRVEADLSDSQALEIAESGHFKGTAVVETADIAGNFEGSVTVTGLLLLRASGRILGNIQYGELEIERGGRIKGTIDLLGLNDPGATQDPEVVEPETATPEAAALAAATSEAATPETATSETAEPDADTPELETTELETTEPEALEPETPDTEAKAQPEATAELNAASPKAATDKSTTTSTEESQDGKAPTATTG
ncbi:MAG: polymer-forming cytoskeletal protein [Pseudomonadota bacterium]